MFRSRKRTEYITIASMENCPRLALEFGLRIGLELGFGAWGGGGGAILLGGNCPTASLW